jgi:hypothetical protein
MERLKGIAIVLLLAAALASAAPQKAANVLLQEGLYAEEVDGDLDAAIRIYQQIIKQADAQRPHVAQAMYRLGMCHLKKQDEAQARAIFARLVADYGDQTKVVDKVKPMLDELSDGDPAALMPPETLLYVEIGSPGKQVETILKMLKGTPFENPLAVIGQGGAPQSGRSYGTALPSTGGGRSSGYSEPGPQNILAGLLNPSMMAEFKKIRGVGIGVTGITENDPPVIVVLYPGKSDALKGLLMAGLTMLGTPGESIEGMQTVLFGDGGGAAYDDTTVIIASPKAHQMGQLIWSVKQHKGLTSEPTLASSNSSFARLSRKDRQDNMLTLWANVDEIFTGLKEILPAEAMPEQYRMADSFVDFGNVDDLTAFVLLEENRIAIEANVAFKDGRRSMAYNMIRTPNLSKAAFYAVPSDAVALLSVATPEADSAQAQMLSGKLKEMTGFEIGGVVFANIDQITLFALPPGAGQAVPGIPPILKSLGVVVTSDDPQQTRQILTGFLMAANMVASQSSEPRDDGRYWIELANKLRIHGYESQAGKATVLSLNPGVTAASVSAIASRKSVADAGPLKEAVSEMSSKTSKLALINVGGMMDFIKADENMNDLVTQLADTCDKTTVRFRTHEEQDNLNVRTEITELPPVGQVIGPAMELAKLVSEEKARQREQARIAKIPASVIHTTEPPEIDGKAEDLWSGIRRHKMVNPAYAPPADRADLTAFYRAMWDDDNLYVLVNVMDESLKNDSDDTATTITSTISSGPRQVRLWANTSTIELTEWNSRSDVRKSVIGLKSNFRGPRSGSIRLWAPSSASTSTSTMTMTARTVTPKSCGERRRTTPGKAHERLESPTCAAWSPGGSSMRPEGAAPPIRPATATSANLWAIRSGSHRGAGLAGLCSSTGPATTLIAAEAPSWISRMRLQSPPGSKRTIQATPNSIPILPRVTPPTD